MQTLDGGGSSAVWSQTHPHWRNSSNFWMHGARNWSSASVKQSEAIGGKTTASIGNKTRKVTHSLDVLEANKCSKCQQFLDMSAGQRFSFAKENALCYYCLKPSHGVRKCKSTFKCRQCKGQHHSLLHLQRTQRLLEKSLKLVRIRRILAHTSQR